MSGAGLASLKSLPALSPSALFSTNEQSSQVFTQKLGLSKNVHNSGCRRRQLAPHSGALPGKQAENSAFDCVGGEFGPGRRQKSNGKSRRHTMQASTIIAPEVEVPKGQDYVRRGGPDADLVAKQAGKTLDQPKLADTVGGLVCTTVRTMSLSRWPISSSFHGARGGIQIMTWSISSSNHKCKPA